MSDINDRLREFARVGALNPFQVAELRRIADCIDSEMVELPKDRDGAPIRVGDTVWGCISGTQMVIHELRLTDRWAISTDRGFSPLGSKVTHTCPDSWERIADELDAWCDGADVDWGACDVPRGIAGRIRKLAEKEGER